MSGDGLNFGSLNEVLERANPDDNLRRSLAREGDFDARANHAEVRDAWAAATAAGTINLLRSAGPVSDAFITSTDKVAALVGPQGSGKTIASSKKILVEGQRVHPGPGGRRRYKIGVYREKYDTLWKATIPSYWKVLPKDLPGSIWTGASPRAAKHIIVFRDPWGEIEITVDFLAFGDAASPEDLRGLEFTDVWLNEIDTMPEELFVYILGRVGRDPPPSVTGRQGKLFGDMNAPDVLNWTYKTFYEKLREGYRLFRQPGGREAGAENLASYATPQDPSGRGYYAQQVLLNADNPWWIRRMVDAIPGLTRAADLVYDKFDELTMVSRVTLKPEPNLPVIVGVDGGFTPAAVYKQEMADGQLRVLAEIALERGGMADLARAMLVLEARRFAGCEFRTVCDPAMKAGEDDEGQIITGKSNRQELAAHLGRSVELARTQEPTRRWAAVRDKVALNLGPQRPGLLLDPSCLGLIRGFLQTYQFLKLRGTNDLSRVAKTFDSHVHDGLQYGACECGTDEARKRKTDTQRARQARREEARKTPRYSPHRRRA